MDQRADGMAPPPQALLACIRATEQNIIDAVCVQEAHAGYVVFRSDKFPNYYGGNGIRIACGEDLASFEKWIDVFHQHFDRARFAHVTLVLPRGAWSPALEASAASLQLFAHHESFMATSSRNLLATTTRALDESVAPARLLSTDEACAGLYALHLEESTAEDWYIDEEDFGRLFEKTIAIAQHTNTRWLAVDHPMKHDAPSFAAALGYFYHQGICRLQEVITSPSCRHRGLATYLLSEAARLAMAANIEHVALLADPEADAHRLYRSLGFEDLDAEVTLMRY